MMKINLPSLVEPKPRPLVGGGCRARRQGPGEPRRPAEAKHVGQRQRTLAVRRVRRRRPGPTGARP